MKVTRKILRQLIIEKLNENYEGVTPEENLRKAYTLIFDENGEIKDVPNVKTANLRYKAAYDDIYGMPSPSEAMGTNPLVADDIKAELKRLYQDGEESHNLKVPKYLAEISIPRRRQPAVVQDLPLAKLLTGNSCGEGYHYDRINAVCVRNDYVARLDYGDELGQLVAKLHSQYLAEEFKKSFFNEGGVPKGGALDRWIRNPERNLQGKIPSRALRHDWYSRGQSGPYHSASEFYDELRSYPKLLSYVNPETNEPVTVTVVSPDDMNDILEPLLHHHPDLQYSVDEGAVEISEAAAPPWFETGYSKFQNTVNDFLDSAGYEPGVWYYWEDEDTLVMLGGEDDANEIQARLNIGAEMKLWNAPSTMNPAVVELENGSWALKLNAQMTQDRY